MKKMLQFKYKSLQKKKNKRMVILFANSVDKEVSYPVINKIQK